MEITHISLAPANDALGFKAKVEGAPETITEIGVAFRVNGGAEKVYTLEKTPEDGIFTARVKNILAAGGGEATLKAYAFVKMGDVTVTSEARTTTMKQALQAVDAAWHTAGYTLSPKEAVKALCQQYEAAVQFWELDNVFRESAPFFGSSEGNSTDSRFDLSADAGASVGTVNVSDSGISLGYINEFRKESFYFETRIHINGIASTEEYSKFGLFVRDGNIRHHFYVDMSTALTATKVGRMTVTDGSFGVQSAKTNNLTAGDPYEVDCKMIFEDGFIYLELEGVLVYKFQSTFTNGVYYFGVTQYADATYTNTQVTYDAAETAAMTAAY